MKERRNYNRWTNKKNGKALGENGDTGTTRSSGKN
jgi:hypothetical protein